MVGSLQVLAMEGLAGMACHHKVVCPLAQAWACPRRQATSRSTCSGEAGGPHQAATISTLSSGGRGRMWCSRAEGWQLVMAFRNGPVGLAFAA